MQKLRFEFVVAASDKDPKSSTLYITSITTEEGEKYELPFFFMTKGKCLMHTLGLGGEPRVMWDSPRPPNYGGRAYPLKPLRVSCPVPYCRELRERVQHASGAPWTCRLAFFLFYAASQLDLSGVLWLPAGQFLIRPGRGTPPLPSLFPSCCREKFPRALAPAKDPRE